MTRLSFCDSKVLLVQGRLDLSLCRTQWRAFFLFVVGICLILVFPVSCHISRTPIHFEQDSADLTTVNEIRRDLAQGELHKYHLALEANSFLSVLVDCKAVRATLTLFSPTNQKVSASSCRQRDVTPILFIAAEKGIYRLEVASQEKAIYRGKYFLRKERLRAATKEDNFRLLMAQAFTAGDRLRLQPGALEKSLEQFSQARVYAEKIGDRIEMARALRASGEIYFQLGKNIDAQAHYEKALDQLPAAERELKCDIINQVSLLEIEQNKARSALDRLTEALKICAKCDDLYCQAQTMDNRGKAYYLLGERLKAVEAHHQALSRWTDIRDRTGMAHCHYELASIYSDLGEVTNAAEHFHKSLSLWRELDDDNNQAKLLIALGNFLSKCGRKQEALDSYAQAKPLLQDEEKIARYYMGVGYLHKSLGEYHKAVKNYSDALLIFQARHNLHEAAGAQLVIGNTFRAMGDDATALEHYQKALTSLLRVEDPQYLLYAWREMGALYKSQGFRERALSYYQKALALSRKVTDRRGEASLLVLIGELHREGRSYALAIRYFQQALMLTHSNNDPFSEAQVLAGLARVEQELGQLTQAKGHIEQAAKMIDYLRASVINQGLRTSYFATVQQIFELYIDILMREQKNQPHERVAAQSLTVSERARARSLLDLLNDSRHNIKQGVDPNLLEQEKALLQTLNGKAERKMQLTGNKEKEPELASLNQELDALNSQIEEVRARIRETSPRYAALTQPQPLKADEVQRLLDDNTMLLEFALGEERSYMWAVTKDSLEAFTLPNRTTIEKLCNEVYALLTAPQKRAGETFQQTLLRSKQANQQYWPQAAELSQMLFSTIAAKLDNKRLIVVSEGALQRIPFAALPEPVVGGRWSVVGPNITPPSATSYQPLIANHEIIHLPSASILKVLRQERATRQAAGRQTASWLDSLWAWLRKPSPPTAQLDSIAILADPVFEKDDVRMRTGQQAQAVTELLQTREVDLSDENLTLNRLPETAVEAGEIEKAAGANAFLLKKDYAVNRALLESEELKQYGIIHFATHGFWDSERPELSGIVLSRYDRQGNKLDGFLRLSDIYNLRMPKELVVLSACETALGKDIRGEGLMALTRGFMYAGATRVIASLWKVEEGATLDLMKVFYGKLLREKLTPAAALREAQIARWRKDPTSVPYDWAAFVLQGEYR
jgi:CHAT domain-containing protein